MGNSSGEFLCIVTRTGAVLHASPSIVSVFDCVPEEIVGRNGFDLVHPEDRNRLRRAAGAVLTRPCTRRVRCRARRKDGEWRWIESTIYKMPDEIRSGTILVNCREIHAEEGYEEEGAGAGGERKAEELLSANARLEHFAYAVAHDLREPLRTVSIFTELLARESKPEARLGVLAQFIAGGVTRMSELLEGLYSFALHGVDRSSQPVDLARVAAGVLQDLKHAIATSGATVTVEPLPFVQGNKVHLVRVLQNLIANAIKYRGEAPVRIHIGAERLGLKWIVKIKDNGVGIEPEYREQVFQLFKRLHGAEIPGSGIGLAVCRKIVESSGDTIWVESGTGSGSTFCFTVRAATCLTIGATTGAASGEGSFKTQEVAASRTRFR